MKKIDAESLLIRKKFEILSYPKGGKENSISFLDNEGNETSFYILYLEDGRVKFCMDFIHVTYQNIEELMYGSTDVFIKHGFMRKTEYAPELKKTPKCVRRRFGKDELNQYRN